MVIYVHTALFGKKKIKYGLRKLPKKFDSAGQECPWWWDQTKLNIKENWITMEEKLKRLEVGESVKKIDITLGVGKSIVGDWKKNWAEIEKWCTS